MFFWNKSTAYDVVMEEGREFRIVGALIRNEREEEDRLDREACKLAEDDDRNISGASLAIWLHISTAQYVRLNCVSCVVSCSHKV